MAYNGNVNDNHSGNAATRQDNQAKVVTFNTAGFAARTATFRLTPEQIKKEFLKFCQGKISDFRNVTLVTDNRNGTLTIYAWIPNSSSHMRDNSMQGTILSGKAVYRLSNEIKDFANRFCMNAQTYPDEGKSGLVGFVLNPSRVLNCIFDSNGEIAAKELGVPKQNAQMNYVPTFGRGTDYKFGPLKYIEVSKTVGAKDLTEPRPTRAFRG